MKLGPNRLSRWISVAAILSMSLLAVPSPTRTTSAAPLGDDDGGTFYPTSGACGRFQDVNHSYGFTIGVDDETYNGIQFMGCRNVVGGYECGGQNEPCVAPDDLPYFRPYSNLTRGQLAKIVTLAHGYNTNYTGAAHFTDVAQGSTFYKYVETAYAQYLMDPATTPPGGACPTNPAQCTFNVGANASRGEAAKASVEAAVYNSAFPTTSSFEDVATSYRYYYEIETAYARHLLTGYPCGAPAEPCIPPDNKPYYRPLDPLFRGQYSKIDTNARFYHKGVDGFGNLVPYRGSPNFDYGAINQPNPDLRTIPSGEMTHYRFTPEAYRAYIYNLMWTEQAVDWFRNDPDAGTTAIEFGLAIDPHGVHNCPSGNFDNADTYTNLPDYVVISGYACGKRILFSHQGVNALQIYTAQATWTATGGTNSTGRLQAYQLQEDCNPKCGSDMTKADMLAHICYKIGTGIVNCGTNY